MSTLIEELVDSARELEQLAGNTGHRPTQAWLRTKADRLRARVELIKEYERAAAEKADGSVVHAQVLAAIRALTGPLGTP